MPHIRIVGVEIENLRGYSNAQLEFGDFRVLVGENNEGKSSALKLIDSLVNRASKEFLDGSRKMTKDEEAFWMPANESRHRARRLTLVLSFTDGRRARPFDPDAPQAHAARTRQEGQGTTPLGISAAHQQAIRRAARRTQTGPGVPHRPRRNHGRAGDVGAVVAPYVGIEETESTEMVPSCGEHTMRYRTMELLLATTREKSRICGTGPTQCYVRHAYFLRANR